jgi:DNA-binding response OmpR family regulator
VESAPQKIVVSHGQETILLVDDEETLREAFCAVLESRGFSVLSASDGEQAVRMFREHSAEVSVVVTDFGLPRRLGSDVVAEIKTIDPDMKTIVLTGYLDADQRNQLRDLKVDAIIMKPTKPDVVAQRIRSILDAV